MPIQELISNDTSPPIISEPEAKVKRIFASLLEPPVSETIDTLLIESRKFAPSEQFKAQANANNPNIYNEANSDTQAWWTGWAENLDWFEKWHTVLEWKQPY